MASGVTDSFTSANQTTEVSARSNSIAERCTNQILQLYNFLQGDKVGKDNNSWHRYNIAKYCLENANNFDIDNFLPCHLMRESNFLSQPIHGYVFLLVGTLTLLTNILICVVLLKKHMRNPTNVLLVAMSIADLLTGVIPVGVFFYFFTLNNYIYWPSCSEYNIYKTMAVTLPTVFHTSSIWLTVALAVQRYICVCRPLDAKKWCTVQNMVIVIALIYTLALLSQISRFFDMRYVATEVPSLFHEKMENGCIEKKTILSGKHEDVYWMIYWGFRVICIHLLPCSVLVIMNGLLVSTMRTAEARRQQLLKQNRNCESRRLADNTRTTFMLVAVVGLFLFVEIPMVFILVVYMLGNTLVPKISLKPEVHSIASLIINMIILLSYPLNFFIYCGMSKQFRETFIEVVKHIGRKRTSSAVELGHTRYMSLSTENGKTIVTSETAI